MKTRLWWLFAFVLSWTMACGGITAPTVKGDPYAIAGAIFQPGLYPDTLLVARYIRYGGDLAGRVDSLIDGFRNLSLTCDEVYTGSGFVADRTILVEWYIGHANGTLAQLKDTVAHYTMATPLDPLNSPLPGWGDDQQHVLRWSVRIDSQTPHAAVTFGATGLLIAQFPTIAQADYCAP